jgi:2-hydroxychromene-2-carboxylate isomerase
MKQITFYLDFISPYAYLAFEQLPRSLQGLSYSVRYVPVLFAGMLKHHGQLGPAEIAPKRDWTYRQVLWQAHALGIAMQMPATHPFNPLALLRLALACGDGATAGDINRYVSETIFRHVWQDGLEAADSARVEVLTRALRPRRDVQAADVKEQLKTNTECAIAAGVFGVPTLEADGRLFWGLDSLSMLRDYLDGGAWFQGEAWQKAGQVGLGTARSVSARP